MEKKFSIILVIILTLFLLLSGCTTDQTTNEETNDETSNQNGDGYDPCGNAIGNGNEIVFGQVTPTDWNPDNPLRSLTKHLLYPNIIRIGTEANGFIKSIDGGITWTRLRYGLRHGEASGEQLYPEVYDIAFSESNPDIIYAAGRAQPILYRSVNGGQTWEIAFDAGPGYSRLFKIKLDPSNPNTVYVSALTYFLCA